MSLLALVSAKRSPGTTTSTLVLAPVWPGRPALVVECDPAGGDVAADATLALEPGLTTLAASRRRFDAASLAGHSQRLWCGADVVVAPPSPYEAAAAVAALADRLAAATVGSEEVDVLADCGRLDPGSPAAPLLAAADLVVVVLRPTVAGVEHVAARIDRLRSDTRGVVLLLVGGQPYPAREVAAFLECGVAGVLADDPFTASVLRRGTPVRRLDRTPLVHGARCVAERLAAMSGAPPGGDEPTPARASVGSRP